MSKAEGIKLLKQHSEYKEVLKPFLIGEELVANFNSQPERFVIDFTLNNVIEASRYKELYKIIEKRVLPEREAKGKKQEDENAEALKNNPKAKVNKHHINFLKNWWKLGYGREDFLIQRENLKRYIAGSRVSTRIFYEFISSGINPNDALICFAFDDDYSFGIVHSKFHVEWLKANCSTLKGDYRYTTDTIWDTFPFPQSPTEAQIKKVAAAAKTLREERTKTMQQHHMSLRDLYRLLEQPGKNPIKDLHAALDKAVLEAYGFDARGKTVDTNFILENLLALNHEVAAKEKRGEKVQPPGLPEWIKNKENYVSEDCVRFKWE